MATNKLLFLTFIKGAALALACQLMLIGGIASAHSANSSSLSVHINDQAVDTKVSIAVEALDEALGTNYTNMGTEQITDQVAAYIEDHFTIIGESGEWTKTYSNVVREDVENIDSFSITFDFDTNSDDPNNFVINYDAITEADTSHEAVVVLTDASDNVSTAGVLTNENSSLRIGKAQTVSWTEIIMLGFHHVLEGLDHLLFLLMLLLAAPLVAVKKRWQSESSIKATMINVFHVITIFTIGHSLTLIAAAIGWIKVPSTPVEVIIAVSVGVAALHAIRPLTKKAELFIGFGFGLIHGLAFAGIFKDLGLSGSNSVITLLSFNVGVELAQLVAAVCVLPSIILLSRTRYYAKFRNLIAGLTITFATFWVLDRLGILAGFLDVSEGFVISNKVYFVIALSILSGAVFYLDRMMRHSRELAT
jgi:hypothetical protein